MNPSARDPRKRSTRLRNLLIVVALLAMALAGAASRVTQKPTMAAVPDLGGTYVEAAVGNPSYLNPVLLQFNQVDRDISSLIFSGLTRFDDTGQLVPDLAESWEVGDGGKSYLFHLRHDVRWHDQTPFTADDVVFTVKAMQDKDFQGSQDVADLWRSVDVQQVDDYTVRFTLKEPFAPFLEYTTVGILPHHLYADALGKAMTDSPYNLKPIGTGPFKLTSISSEGVTLEPNTDDYRPAPHLAQIQFRFYPDYTSALAALQKGEVDGLPYLAPQDVATLSANAKLQIYSAPDYLKYSVLFLNNSNPLFKDKAVRQAVSYAINRDKIIQTVLSGQGLPGKGPISPGSWAFDPSAGNYGYDPKKAEALLDAAGWRDTNGDGVREKDGATLSFVILTNDNQQRVKIGESVAEDLRKVGFKTEVQAAAWADLIKDYLTPRTFVGFLTEQWLLTADPDVYSLWDSSQIGNGGFNFAGISNPRVDQLLEEARSTVDKTRRQQLYSEFQSLWADESPSVILYYPKFNWAVSRNIKGVNLSYMVDGSSRFRDAAGWYVNTKMVPQDDTKK
ncbi:MAG: ABC transporter substrate-binding protein [Actinobacteria bacterium]|nr:ABC transporter substrate-binding protein [Actinomycetota bacterium]